MNKINYQKELEKEINKIEEGQRPSLLLHACCAPCSSYCVEYLSQYFDITLYFYNPNMSSEEEFNKRYLEFKKIQDRFAGVKVISAGFNPSEFYDIANGLEKEKEGGPRCFKCYRLRLEKTAQFAKDNRFDYFASTLSISPYKNAEKLNEIGFELEKICDIKYLVNDFKKNGGYLRSIELSKELDLYRQDFCGCIYSIRQEG